MLYFCSRRRKRSQRPWFTPHTVPILNRQGHRFLSRNALKLSAVIRFVCRLGLKAWIWALETHYRARARLMTSAVTRQAGVRHHLRQTQQVCCLLKGQEVRAKSSVFMGAPMSIEIMALQKHRSVHMGTGLEKQALARGRFKQVSYMVLWCATSLQGLNLPENGEQTSPQTRLFHPALFWTRAGDLLWSAVFFMEDEWECMFDVLK